MKKFAWVMGIILLTLAVLAASCAKAPPAAPAATPATEQPEVAAVEGHLGDVNVEKSTVTLHTDQGTQTFPIGPNTALTLNGEACTLDQLATLQVNRGDNFDCSVVYDSEGNVLTLNVFQVPTPASVRGTISDVNIKESTITVKTATGDKVFDVDPDTGLMIGGVACSLELVNALVEAQQATQDPGPAGLPCTVIYTTDDKGTALYIDIASPPGLVQGIGTIEKVDVAKSTVTIMTDSGERTFEVDANTGHFLNGEVCSLEDIQDASEHGPGIPARCQVLYYTDENGNLIYLDITHTVNP